MKVLSILVRQIRIYPPELLPFTLLFTGFGSAAFRKHLGFRELSVDPSLPEVTFLSGLAFLPGREATPVVINYVQINSQRITLEVEGDTATANEVFAKIWAVFTELRGGAEYDADSYVILNHETVCVAQLDFPWTDLISEPLRDFQAEMTRRVSSPGAQARLTGFNCRFTFQFDAVDVRIREQGVILTDKPFTIEPRQSSSLSERIFYTTSPLDSDAHTAWMRELEQRLSGQRPPRKRKR